MISLEHRLRAALAQSGDDRQQARARADLAAFLARMGRYPEAEHELQQVPESARWGSAELAASLLFAEAMMALRDEFNLGALDRLRRGHAIASAARLPAAAVDFASWAAHAEFNQDRLDGMAHWVRQCLDLITSATPTARARLALTCATAWLATGHRPNADAWFARVRAHVARTGDEAFMAAALYNRAAYGVWLARLEWAEGRTFSVPLAHLHMEIESAEHYAAATGNEGARQLQRLWKARVLLLMGRPAEALELLDAALPSLPEGRHSPFAQYADTDRLQALVELGRRDEAQAAWSAGELPDLDAAVPPRGSQGEHDGDTDPSEPVQAGADGLRVWMHQRMGAAAALGRPTPPDTAQRIEGARRRHQAYVQRLSAVVERLHQGLLAVPE
jgi:tetratricopeptide (TPR) repeat protein